MTDGPEITLDEFETARAAGEFVLDVRERDEYADKHVPGVTLVPMGELAQRLSEVPNAGRILVICRSGRRSLTSAQLLREHGYDAVSVAGGTDGWAASGREISTGDTP